MTAAVGTAALAVGVIAVVQPASAAVSQWKAVSAGAGHTCGIKDDTTVWCWGANDAGQLGTGDNVAHTTPTPTRNGGNGWTAISAGTDFTCGIRATLRLCWGANASGQLGLGLNDTVNRNVPTSQPGDLTRWMAIDTGLRHACAIVRTGSSSGPLKCWGSNTVGQLGTGDATNHSIPAQISLNAAWLSVSTGSLSTCAVQSGNLRYCWGVNDDLQLGLRTGASDPQLTPFRDSGDRLYSSLDMGDGTTCAIASSNKNLYCYGANTYGNGGVGITTPTLPALVSDGTDWQMVSSGGYHACGIYGGNGNGSLWCWGRNNFGQLGLGANDDRLTENMQSWTEPWTSVSAGFNHTCAIRAAHLYCFGYNAQGQLGIGTTTAVNTPSLVS